MQSLGEKLIGVDKYTLQVATVRGGSLQCAEGRGRPQITPLVVFRCGNSKAKFPLRRRRTEAWLNDKRCHLITIDLENISIIPLTFSPTDRIDCDMNSACSDKQKRSHKDACFNDPCSPWHLTTWKVYLSTPQNLSPRDCSIRLNEYPKNYAYHQTRKSDLTLLAPVRSS
jgi:hypothetical protein